MSYTVHGKTWPQLAADPAPGVESGRIAKFTDDDLIDLFLEIRDYEENGGDWGDKLRLAAQKVYVEWSNPDMRAFERGVLYELARRRHNSVVAARFDERRLL